jgi:oligopeptide transport system substrate-binding protein
MKKYSVILSIASILLAVLTWWTWNQLQLKISEGEILKLSLENNIESLDPAKAFADDVLTLTSQTLEPLYQYHYLKRPYEIQPLLAASMPQVLDDGKLIKIKIKKGIYFHPHAAWAGLPRELTAHDFVLQFKRLAIRNLNSPGRNIFTGLVKGFEEYDSKIEGDWKKIINNDLPGVFASDDWTLNIHLIKPEPNLIYYLALNFITPIPWELVRYYQNNLDNVLIGTGPYVFSGFNGEYFKLIKNKNYRKEFYPSSGDRYANVKKMLTSTKEMIPFINEVRFYVSSNEKIRWEKFLSRELDLLSVPKTYLPSLYNEEGKISSQLEDKGIEIKHFPFLANRWLGFNMRDEVVGKNEYLRRAIAYAIDYEEYIKILSQNTNLRSNSLLVPGIAGYAPNKSLVFKFDLNLAKKFLEMAGYRTPDQMPTIVYSTRGNQAINLVEAQFIKRTLEQIGLKVSIQVLNFSDFLKKGRAGELMFFTDNWIFDYPDGESIIQVLHSSNAPGINKSGYSNPRVDELYEKLKATTNLDQRNEIFQEIENIVFEELPWIPLMYESSFVVQYPEIKNFRKSSLIRNYVKYLKIER